MHRYLLSFFLFNFSVRFIRRACHSNSSCHSLVFLSILSVRHAFLPVLLYFFFNSVVISCFVLFVFITHFPFSFSARMVFQCYRFLFPLQVMFCSHFYPSISGSVPAPESAACIFLFYPVCYFALPTFLSGCVFYSCFVHLFRRPLSLSTVSLLLSRSLSFLIFYSSIHLQYFFFFHLSSCLCFLLFLLFLGFNFCFCLRVTVLPFSVWYST